MNDRGLGRPTEKHEKRRSGHERANHVCFSVNSEGPNFYRSQSTAPTDDYLLAMSKGDNAIFFVLIRVMKTPELGERKNDN